MAFAVPIMKTNFNLYLFEEKVTKQRKLSICSTSSSTSSSSSSSEASFRGSQNSLTSTSSSRSTRSKDEVLYKSRWDLTDTTGQKLGKFDV